MRSCSQGYWGVYRITFVLAAFHLVMMALTSVTSPFSTYVHSGYWWTKVLGVAAMLVAVLFAPNDLFAYYAWVARCFAPLFLVYQLIVYIDFGYNTNAQLLDRDDKFVDLLCCANPSGQRHQQLMLVVSLSLIIGSISHASPTYTPRISHA